MFGRKSKSYCGENHHHYSKLVERSNVIQYGADGYPLRLCIYKCEKCGKTHQVWIDTVANKDDVIVRWEKVE